MSTVAEVAIILKLIICKQSSFHLELFFLSIKNLISFSLKTMYDVCT